MATLKLRLREPSVQQHWGLGWGQHSLTRPASSNTLVRGKVNRFSACCSPEQRSAARVSQGLESLLPQQLHGHSGHRGHRLK